MIHKHLIAALLMVLAASPAFSADKKAAAPKAQSYGDWGKACEKGPKGKDGKQLGDICYIFQNVSNKKTGKLVMQVRIGMATAKKKPVLIVTVPLGVLIPPGAALVVEGAKPLKLPYLACGPEGCTTVGQVMGDKLIATMKKGDKAAIRVALINRQVLTLPISLKGFTRANVALRSGKH
jgi:invasion protein IalB